MLHAKFQDNQTSSSQLRRKIRFYHVWTWRPTFIHPSHGGSRFDMALIDQSVSEKMPENNVYILVHGPPTGTDTPLGSKCLYKHKTTKSFTHV